MAYAGLGNLKPELWAPQILTRLNDMLVFGSVVNRDYEGMIRNYGDTVRISEVGPVTINSYSSTSTGALTIQALSDAQKILQINQSKYFAVWIDDIDARQSLPKVVDELQKNSAWAIANNVDEYLAGLWSEAANVVGGTSGTGQDITSTNVLKYLSIAQQKLDENNTPQEGRWVVAPAWFIQKMILAEIVHRTDNNGVMTNGKVGSTLFGFDVYQSNNVVNGASAGDNARILFGHRMAMSLAVQILNSETVRPSINGGFKTLYRGLVVYGAKVVRPNQLAVLHADYVAEAT